MRVTRETLIRLAKETAQERAYNDKSIIAAYLTGSLLTEDPFLGGVTDVDLVLIVTGKPFRSREIVKLTPDFHLDISFRSKSEYSPPRELRVNPWLGYEIYDPMLLYESQHFFEYTQASVRAGFEFHQPAQVLTRCRKLLDHGRQIWFDLMDTGKDAGPKEIAKYLKSIYHAANAVAELHGPPLPERRLLLLFPGLAQQAGRPGMSAGLLGLLGGVNLDRSILVKWLQDWEKMFLSAYETGKADPRIHPARLAYYQKCFESMLSSDDIRVVLWPLLNTWTFSAVALSTNQSRSWYEACTHLGLTEDGFIKRVQGLDLFLDETDILLDELAVLNGLGNQTDQS